MRNVLRWLATGALAVTVTTAPGCGDGGTGGTPDAASAAKCEGKDPGTCECTKNTDCGANRFEWICTPAKACVRICENNSQCAAYGADYTCDDAICRPPACANDAQCNNGQQCIGGKCEAKVTAASVASCLVVPTSSLLHQGKTEKFTVVARDTAGNVLAFKDAVTWSSSADSIADVSAEGVATGDTAAGTAEVRATIGSVTCAAANVRNYAAAAEGKFRVVVADLNARTPVAGAKVVLGEETKETGADGSVEFDVNGNSPRDVHAFHANYAYVSAIGVQAKDIILYTKAPQTPAKFTGNMDSKAFYSLSDLKGTVRLALHGASIAGNLIDIELATLLGDFVDTEVDLGSQKTTVPLPEGTVFGLGEQMFRGDTGKNFTIVSPPGVRTIWGLGGNAEFSTITQALAPALSGSGEDLNIGEIMTKLLPLLGRLQSGALTGVNAVAGETTDLNVQEGTKKNDAGQDVPRMVSKLKLNTLLRIRAEAALPALPTYNLNGTTTKFEGAVVLGGALHGSQGLVPLGITAGIDENGDGQVDSNETGGTAGTLSLRVAPLHSGMESSRYAALALAASFGGLIGGGESAEDPPLVLSGLVALPETLNYNSSAPTALAFPSSFLGVPSDPTITGRAVALGGAVPGASFHRLSIGGAETGEWLVYFPAGGSGFSLPEVPSGFTDRFTVLDGNDLPQVLVNSMRLGSTGLTYEDVMAFDGKDMDDLTVEIDAFSVREIKRPSAE